VAGVNPDKLVECHGHFRSASCIACQRKYDAELCKSSMTLTGEAPSCNVCGGIVKPDITFFGGKQSIHFNLDLRIQSSRRIHTAYNN